MLEFGEKRIVLLGVVLEMPLLLQGETNGGVQQLHV